MSLEDPFFVVKAEVVKALASAQGLHQRWGELEPGAGSGGGSGHGGHHGGHHGGREELEWTSNELRNALRSLEWDLEDLAETVSIVETNPRKFKMDSSELGDRKAFIARTRQSVKEMKEDMASPRSGAVEEGKSRKSLLGGGPRGVGGSGGGAGGRYGRLEQEMDLENSRYIADTHAQQQLIVQSQDEQLELVSGSLGVLKHMSERIGTELDDQDRMLGDFSQELDVTQSRMDGVLKKLAKVSRMTSDRRQWIAILVLLGLMLLVLILFFTL
ncbi:syntaxin-6-like [Lampetra planeri]